MKKLILILSAALGLNANATGGFFCEYKDESLALVLNGVTTRSFENDVVDANAELSGEVGDDGFYMKADQKFIKSDVRQYWNTGDEFRVLLYAEDEIENKNTNVKIVTKAEPDGVEFKGTMSIEQSSPKGSWSINVPISCSLE